MNISRLSPARVSLWAATTALVASLAGCDGFGGLSGPIDEELNRKLFDEACVPEDRVFPLDEVFKDPDWDAICWTVEYGRSNNAEAWAKETLGAPAGEYRHIPKIYYQEDSDRIISLVDFETKTVRSFIVGPKAYYDIAGNEFCYSREFAMARCIPPHSYFKGRPFRYIEIFDARDPETE